MTITEFAQAIFEAYQSSPSVEGRWHLAATTAMAKLDALIPTGAGFHVHEDGEIRFHDLRDTEEVTGAPVAAKHEHEDLIDGA